MVSLGEIWYKIDSQSLSVSQAGIQRYVAPWLWEPVITTILFMPAWVVFGAPSLLLLWVGRKKFRAKRRRYQTGIYLLLSANPQRFDKGRLRNID